VRQHHASHIHVQRAKLALLLAEHPDMTTAEIARRLGTGTSFVWVWRKRWTVEAFSLDDRPRPGRPPHLSSGSPPKALNGQGHLGDVGAVGG
jgi:transposase